VTGEGVAAGDGGGRREGSYLGRGLTKKPGVGHKQHKHKKHKKREIKTPEKNHHNDTRYTR